MARPCTDLPNAAVVHPSAGTGDGMSEGGRTSHVVGCSVPGLQANWPTTGAAGVIVVGVVSGGTVTVGAVAAGVVVVAGVVVGDVASDNVEVDVGSAVDVAVAVGGELLGPGAEVSSTDALGAADDSVRVVHPAASPTVSTAQVRIEGRWSPTNGRDPTRTVCPRSPTAAGRATTSPGAHISDVCRAPSRPWT